MTQAYSPRLNDDMATTVQDGFDKNATIMDSNRIRLLGGNLFNPADIIDGYYVQQDGSGDLISTANAYSISGNIPCEEGETYLITGQSMSHYNLYLTIRDINDINIEGSFKIPEDGQELMFTAPPGSVYFIMTVRTSLLTHLDAYDPDKIQVYKIPSYGDNYVGIENKTWHIYGDSITAEGETVNPDGTNSGDRLNWTTKFSQKVKPRSWNNIALPSATWTDRAGYSGFQWLSNQVATAIANFDKPDIIVINMGTNDMNGPVPLGDYDTAIGKSIGTLDRTLFAEAVRYNLYTLKNEYPKAIIFVCTPLQTYSQDSQSSQRELMHDLLVRMANRYGAILINQRDESGIVSDWESFGADGRYLVDGLHTNENGRTIQREFIYNRVVSYLNNNLAY